MSNLELILVNENTNCTLYTIQFVSENESEFERFYAKFKDDVEYNQDLMRIVTFIDKILILGNGGVKNTRTYNEDNMLKGYVITLQKFEQLLKDGIDDGSVIITTNTIETNKTFDI